MNFNIKLSFFCLLIFLTYNDIHTTPTTQSPKQPLPAIHVAGKDGKTFYTIAGQQVAKKHAHQFASGLAIIPVATAIGKLFNNTQGDVAQLCWTLACIHKSYTLQDNRIPSDKEALSFIGGLTTGLALTGVIQLLNQFKTK